MTRRSTLLFLVVGLAVLSAAPASGGRAASQVTQPSSHPPSQRPRPTSSASSRTPRQATADPFTSVHNPTVHFVDQITTNLNVYDAGGESNGKGLGIFSDDASALLILLDVPTTRLSIRVGNDHPSVVLPGDRATLTLYRNGDQVARRHVTLNDNDLGDQFIQYQGRVAIDRATLVYNRAGTPLALIEVVDDIALAQVCAIRGNRRANTLNGNAGPNGICGLNGRDSDQGPRWQRRALRRRRCRQRQRKRWQRPRGGRGRGRYAQRRRRRPRQRRGVRRARQRHMHRGRERPLGRLRELSGGAHRS